MYVYAKVVQDGDLDNISQSYRNEWGVSYST